MTSRPRWRPITNEAPPDGFETPVHEAAIKAADLGDLIDYSTPFVMQDDKYGVGLDAARVELSDGYMHFVATNGFVQMPKTK